MIMLRFGTAVAAVGVGAMMYLHPPQCLGDWLSQYPQQCAAAYGAAVAGVLYLLPSGRPSKVDPTGKAVLITGETRCHVFLCTLA